MNLTDQKKAENERIDAEATQFAMELLMPADWVREEVRKLGGIDLMDTRAVKKLADKFRVDAQVMAIRIGQVSERQK